MPPNIQVAFMVMVYLLVSSFSFLIFVPPKIAVPLETIFVFSGTRISIPPKIALASIIASSLIIVSLKSRVMPPKMASTLQPVNFSLGRDIFCPERVAQ